MARTPARQPEPDLFGLDLGKVASTGDRWPPDDLEPGTLAEARQMSVTCTRCDLFKSATQTVFGEGRKTLRSCWSASNPATRKI